MNLWCILSALRRQVGLPRAAVRRSSDCLGRGCIEALEVLQANALSPETNRNSHKPVGLDSRTLADPSANKVLMINMKYYHMLTFLRGLNNPREIDAPAGVKPVDWRLLTNRVADLLEQVGLVHVGGIACSL
jgi:hypothetical protein